MSRRAVLLSAARIPHHQLSCYVDSVLSPGPESLILWARRDSDIGHLGKYGLEMTGLILTLDSRTQSVQVDLKGPLSAFPPSPEKSAPRPETSVRIWLGA